MLRFFLALIVCTPAVATPRTEALSLADALVVLRERSVDLRLSATTVSAAAGDARAARAIANPGISANVAKSFICPAEGCHWLAPWGWGAGLSDSNATVDALSGKRGFRVRAGEAGLEAAEAARDDAERLLVLDVAQQYVQTLVLQESVLAASDSQRAAEQLVSLTQVRFRSGAVSEADLLKVETDALEAAQALDGASLAWATARQTLATLLGVPEDARTLRLLEPTLLSAPEADPASIASLPQFLANAEAARPDLREAAARVARADASAALTRRQRFPDIGLSIQYVQQGTDATAITPPTLTFGLTSTLPLFDQLQGPIARAEADANGAQLQLERARQRVRAEVASAWDVAATARRLVQRMDSGLFARAERVRNLVRYQYEKGAASLLELIDAERTFRAIRLERLQDLGAYWSAVLRLKASVGEPVEVASSSSHSSTPSGR